jgi:hypothetical protein
VIATPTGLQRTSRLPIISSKSVTIYAGVPSLPGNPLDFTAPPPTQASDFIEIKNTAKAFPKFSRQGLCKQNEACPKDG